MPKRTLEEKKERYARKIRRLEEKLLRNNDSREISIYSNPDSDTENPDGYPQNYIEPPLETLQVTEPAVDLLDIPVEQAAQPSLPSEPELPAEYLSALGDTIDDSPQYGPDIHGDLAQRWLPILRKGLPKDVKEKLLSEHFIPNNCKLLKAPSLNLEISAAVTESLRSRDKKLELAQDQLGKGITAINKATSLLLTTENKVLVIKMLSDASRILSDLHHYNTEQRVKLLTPSLDKAIINIIENSEDRDETLFGSNLSDKIKTAKSIEKQGLAIKKSAPVIRNAPSTSGPPRPRQGNWTGPPRAQTTRGGRNAARTVTNSAPNRRTTATLTQTRSTYANRNRAPQRR